MVNNEVFVELVVGNGIIDRESCARLLRKYKGNTFSLLKHLAQANPHGKLKLARLWGDSMGVAHIDLRKTLFQRDIVRLLPEEFARKHHILLLYQFGEAITAAVSDLKNHVIISEAERICGRSISPVFAFAEDIEAAVDCEYQSADQLKELSSRIVTDSVIIEDITELTREQLTKVAGTQGVVEFVKGLLLLGIKEHASDIHIEPMEESAKVRFRIDGVLHERSRFEKALLPPIISRLKILADLDIIEKRRPQDGRIGLTLPNRTVDFRFSSIPTVHGEKAVMRILGDTQEKDVPAIKELGFSKANLDMILKVMDTPYGIFFVTGPTGSGKTTTLFSMLNHLNKPGVNIMTIEDPVEYRLSGINQVQLNTSVDLDFPSALRSFLRQDPDIILVGEIRDRDTAEIACRAALTGHFVFATLHANNAVQASTRLMDMGVQPHIVAPSVVGIMSQRLVRRICDNCKTKYLVTAEDSQRLLACGEGEIFFYRGQGCVQCNNSGYSGRIAIHEMLLINDELRTQIVRGDSTSEMFRTARLAGYKTMRYDGMKKVLRGLTTIDELERVTVADED